MWVIKIGGSLETAPGLRSLLALLADYGPSGLVIVPGGGRFAERVRQQQRQTGIDDMTAHRRALLAMQQYGALLCELEPRLYPAADIGGLRGAVAQAEIPVWFPARMLSARTDIPANWQVTSDSLALWLAGELNAEALILVKSMPNSANNAQQLAASAYLDAWFPQMMATAGVNTIACASIEQPEVLQQALSSGAIPTELQIT